MMLRLRVVAAGVCVVACACHTAYRPGRLVGEGEGETRPRARRLGCLDVEVSPGPIEGSKLKVDYRFGNRCDHALHLDWSRARVRARIRVEMHDDGDSREYQELSTDAENWVDFGGGDAEPGELDSKASGAQSHSYHAPWPDAVGALDRGGIVATLLELCIDLRNVTDRPASPNPVCFGPGDDEVPLWAGSPEVNGGAEGDSDRQWDVEHDPDLATGGGMSVHTIPLQSVSPHNDGYRFPQQSLGTATAWSVDYDALRLGFGRFHVDVADVALGIGQTPQTTLQPSQVGASAGGGALYVSLGGLVGAELLRLGPASLDLDLALGARYLRVPNNLNDGGAFPSCIGKTKSGSQRDLCGDFDFWFGQVQPRAVVDLWTSPWVSISPWFGVDIVPLPLGFSGGVMMLVHSRSFGEAW